MKQPESHPSGSPLCFPGEGSGYFASLEQEIRALSPEIPASLDARMERLFSRPTALPFWRRPAYYFLPLSGMAAGIALAILIGPSLVAPAARPPVSAPAISPVAPEIAAAPAEPLPASVRQGCAVPSAVPVGFQYQGSRTVYAEEVPTGTIIRGGNQSYRTLLRTSLERRSYVNPDTHAKLEVDEPVEKVVLENLPVY